MVKIRNYIANKDTRFILFSLGNYKANDYKDVLLWEKLSKSFNYDHETTHNLVFIKHPRELYVGLSIRSDKESLLERKIKRYSEGLAYLLVYYFPESNIRVLNQRETLNAITNILNEEGIQESLIASAEEQKNIDGEIRIIFSRAIDPRLPFGKLFEFYEKEQKDNPLSIDRRVGVKSAYDERILSVLKNPVLAYAFGKLSSQELLEKKTEEVKAECLPNKAMATGFFDIMGVPDEYVEMIHASKTSSDLFDNPRLFLTVPEKVMELIFNT